MSQVNSRGRVIMMRLLVGVDRQILFVAWRQRRLKSEEFDAVWRRDAPQVRRRRGRRCHHAMRRTGTTK